MIAGNITALITPFKKNGNVDFVALEKIILWQIESGIDGILVVGSTGEGLLLNNKEREAIIGVSIEIIKNKVPLIVGCSCASTDEAIVLAKQAQKLKADAILSVVPYYVKPTQQGIIQHFTNIHDNSGIPIIIYNNPGRCAAGISVASVIELSNKTRIIAMKDSDSNLSRVTALKDKIPELTLFSGDDPSLLGYLSCGGDGAISVTSNIVPSLVSNMINSWKNGDIHEAQRINALLSPISEALFVESNPIPIKYALYKKGLLENELRRPLTKACIATEKIIDFLL